MPIVWLHAHVHDFPDPEWIDSTDVIAVGGDISPERLVLAYQKGIFPWYNEGEPILWWSPDPRMVLFPNELVVAKSMRPYFNQNKYTATYNVDFQGVMKSCMDNQRPGQTGGSWITDELIASYTQLHHWGLAHSIEVWEKGDDQPVGGLYGVAIGRIFYGESMFMRRPNASKFGFIKMVEKLRELGFHFIDCQQETPHLASLGARLISRAEFMQTVRQNATEPAILKGVFNGSGSL